MKKRTAEEQYAEQLDTQMRKGLLVYCALVLFGKGGSYNTSEIIRALKGASLDVAGGTIYPLLSRLSKDGLLQYDWQESPQGPPRKFYRMSEKGYLVLNHLQETTSHLQTAIKELERI